MMNHKSTDTILFWVFFIGAFSLRLVYALTLEMPIAIRGDGVHYVQYASNLIEHFTFSKDRSDNPIPDSYWAPGYPTFLALCMLIAKLLGLHFYIIAIFMQTILGGLIAAFSYKLGRMLFSYKGALLVGVLTALSPHLISHGAYILSETLLAFLLIISIYFYIKAINFRCKYFFVSGLFFGLCYLINPVVLVVPFFLSLYSLFFYGEKKVIIFIVGFLSIVAVWSVRGLCIDARASTSDRAFENLVIGSHSNYHDIWRANPRDKSNPYEVDMKKYRNDHISFYKELTSRVINDPTHYIQWYLVQKPLDLWGWNILVGQGDIYVYTVTGSLYSKSSLALASWAVMKNTHCIFVFFCLLGIFCLYKEEDRRIKESLISIYILLCSVSVVYILLHSDARYSVPMRPEMYVCAIYSIKVLWEVVRKKHFK